MIPDILPKVFISSTIIDLRSERTFAKKAVESIPALPIMSEVNFLASNKNSLNVCETHIKAADIYVLILGGKYGYITPKGISVTEYEYDVAVKEKKPILVFNLNYYEKDELQRLFASRVGDISTGYFWCGVNVLADLEKKIYDALTNLIKEDRIRRKQTLESVYLSLHPLQFPEYLYIADYNFNRNEIITESRIRGNILRKNAPEREIIQAALKIHNLSFSADWTSFSKKIITFHDLSNPNIPLTKIVENVDSIRSEEFYNMNSDYKNVFRYLLHNCLKQKIYRFGIQWQNEDKCFIYVPLAHEESNKITRSWQGRKKATRTVFERVMKNNKQNEILKCKHLSFNTRFYFIDDKWYLSIIPNWFISFDEYRKSFYGDKDLKYLKKKERNKRVYNHFMFISSTLRNYQEQDLFGDEYPYLQIKGPLKFNSFPVIKDHLWLNSEKVNEKSEYMDEEDIGLEWDL